MIVSSVSASGTSLPRRKVDFDCNVFSVIAQIFSCGDIFTKLSFLIFGLSNLVRGQIIKGLIFLGTEVAFFVYLFKGFGAFCGVKDIKGLITLGEVEPIQEKVLDPISGMEVIQTIPGDDSSKFLLYGVVSMLIIAAFVLLWKANVKSAYIAQYAVERGKKPVSIFRDITALFDKNLHNTLLFFPLVGILAFTITPLIYMILAAFTNFDKNHNGINATFDWVGLKNFGEVLGQGGTYGTTFWRILGWTIIWAIFATFLCYIGGMLLAMLINRRGLKFKSLWRTVFVMSVAVPQFVTLLTMRTFIEENGTLDTFLRSLGILGTTDTLGLLNTPLNARISVILVNCWVGIPYTMLIMTGILMNIPADLYESAKIDGATKYVMFFKITLPYMIFVTTPHLIQQFIGNINNFNVIYLLTGGGPSLDPTMYQSGSTDLLVTWLYKITLEKSDYCFASAIGICVFIICATLSLITYRRSGSYKNEEEFQ